MKSKSLILALYIPLILVMFILPYFSAEGYSIFLNTTSHLGAQKTPNSWIMNLTFFLLGLACIKEGLAYLKNYRIHRLLLIGFGISLIFTAIFKHAPINGDLSYSILEDKLHSIFASLVGFSFSLFVFSVIFIEKTKKRRIIALLIGFSSSALSLLMFTITDYTGIWQRLIFIISFGWIIFFLRGIDTENKNLVDL